MFCEECKKRPATVHLTRIINNQKSELHLCEECARRKGELHITVEPNFSINNLLAGLLNDEANFSPPVGQPKNDSRCPGCGLRYSDFRQIGRVGCSECYREFAPKMQPLLRRIHGSSKHLGKVPRRSGQKTLRRREISRLREELSKCVQREEYEQAAQLRDKIKELEKDND
ncbi:MAG: UvrB/UvrC motif-containing protein [bacterium]